jgi:hypothetical protein
VCSSDLALIVMLISSVILLAFYVDNLVQFSLAEYGRRGLLLINLHQVILTTHHKQV